jgi:hypothetical protein
MAPQKNESRLFLLALLLLLASLFVLIIGIGADLPRDPVYDVAYVIGVALIYLAIAMIVIHARRFEARYRRPVDDPVIARKIAQKNVIQVILFATALATSIYGAVGAYHMLHVVPIFGGSPPPTGFNPATEIIPAVLCVLASIFTFLAGGVVHTTIAELRRNHLSQTPQGQAELLQEKDDALAQQADAREKPRKPVGNILLFFLAAILVIITCAVLVFNDDMLKYHDSDEGWITLIVFVPAIIAMLVGLLHLFSSLSNLKRARRVRVYPAPTSRPELPAQGNVPRVVILIALFAVLGTIGFQNITFVLAQPTPSEADLYITSGFTLHANSSTLPTSTTGTWGIPQEGIDDIKVYIGGVAFASCGAMAVINFSVVFFNGSDPLGHPYLRSSTNTTECSAGAQSKATIGWKWWGFPVAQMENFSINLTIYPHSPNTDAYLTLKIYIINDLNLLYLDLSDVVFMYGAIVFAGWMYALVSTLTLIVHIIQIRARQKAESAQSSGLTGGWGQDDASTNEIPWRG